MARYNSNGSNAFGISIKTDSAKNVYVLTHQAGTAPGSYYGLLKYTPSGSLIGNVSFNFDTTTDGNVPTAFDVTAAGDAYITGNGGTVSTNSIVTVKFNSGGVFQWARVIPTADANDIKVDKQGYAIVAGDIKEGSVRDSYIVKYKPNGDTLFTRKYRPASNSGEFVKVLVDNSGNIYGCGDFSADYAVVKYDSSGNFMWYTSWTSSPNYQDYVSAAAIDSLKNLYLVGTTVHPYSGGFSNYLTKINSGGNISWAKEFVGVLGDSGCGIPAGMAVTPDGSAIYYTVNCYSNTSAEDIITLKYNASGDSVWVRRYNGGAPNGNNAPAALKLDKYGNIYVTGTGNYLTSGDNYATLKYLSNGILQWMVSYNGPLANSFDDPEDIFIDTSLNVYVTGASSRYNGSPILWDATSIKYSQPNGIQQVTTNSPTKYDLGQNYPNPFNPNTKFKFEIPKQETVKITVYDILGREVEKLINEIVKPGLYEVNWDAANYSSGIYFYTLVAGTFRATKKAIIIK